MDASETTGDQGAQAFLTAFLQVAKDENAVIPPALQQFLPDPDREDMKNQQKLLNRMGTIKQKIQGKEKALAKDEIQWKKWLEEVKQVVETQKQQHEDTQEKLQKELKQLQQEEESLRNQKASEVMEISEDESAEPKVEDLLSSLLSKHPKQEEPKNANPDEDLQSHMNNKMQEMQAKLQEDFALRLRAAEEAMERRYASQLQKQMQTVAPVAAPWTAIKQPEVINLLEEKQELVTTGVNAIKKKGADQRYGAERSKLKTEASPYRKDQGEPSTMEERLRRSHGVVPSEKGWKPRWKSTGLCVFLKVGPCGMKAT